ncbi:MAG: Ig-like domain-containing protein [Ilumatobacteraceae bacterium]
MRAIRPNDPTPTLGKIHMRLGHRYVWTAAGIAALAFVAAPLPAMAEDADAATGDLTVTRFDDRYADGLFDTSKTSQYGEVDRLNTSLAAQLIDVNGTRHYKSADADGLYRFSDVPAGPATLYLGHPNNPANEVFFDATGAANAGEIVRMDTREYYGAQGALDLVIVEGDQARLIGMTALGIAAKVSNADGTPVSGLTGIEFGSGGRWFAGTEYAGMAGGYEALQGFSAIRHLPGELGLRVTAPAGYRVASVTAATGSAPLSHPDIPMAITERDGAYWVDALDVPQYFFSAGFHVTLEELPDTTRPTTTLVSPTTAGPFRALSVQVDAADAKGLKRIVANVYKDGVLVKSTQTAVAAGATTATHTATVSLPDGAYTVKYNAQDLAGNISETRTFAVTIDTTSPTVTVKDGTAYTVGSNGVYDLVSLKLFDAQKVDKVVLNGKVKDLTDNAWSDVNFIAPGTFGAVRGANTLVVYDVAGNSRTITFTLN